MKAITIHTDGACLGNPGPGGWAALLRFGRHERLIAGAEPDTTNNRMELMAAISALEALSQPCQVALYTDSEYVRRGITEWLPNWRARNWRTASGGAVKNRELWQRLEQAACAHRVHWHWVKAHAGDPDNERVDAAARARARSLGRAAADERIDEER
ncbi:MAG TPA: ribonuclease HI, partial [Xanthomonadales bacterium]|nr:ribonuclease HI [Xanthomonadales bacterium]